MTNKLRAKNFKDLTGKEFGKWKVLNYSHNGGVKNKQPFWDCIYQCGATKKVGSNSLRNGSSSCLNCRKTCEISFRTIERKEELALNNIYARYRIEAKNRNYEFNLTLDDFKKYLKEPCFYCGVYESSYQTKHNQVFKYNGIDRVDNSEGYNLNNCVTCCKNCNSTKKAVTKEIIIKAYNFLMGNKNES